MAQGELDSFQGVKFDLGRGLVSVDDASYRVLVPSELLAELLAQSGSDTARDFGRRIGTEMGRRVSSRLGDKTKQASVEEMLGELGAELGLAGLGSLGVERWGRALVMTVGDSPLGRRGDGLIASVLEGAIQRALGRDAVLVLLGHSDHQLRLLVVSPRTAARVEQWLASGTPWTEALNRLHQSAAQGGGGE
jgi:hypothetical protein